MRNGIEIWIDQEKAESLLAILSEKNAPQFITFEGRLINKADLTGVYLPEDMEEMTFRKNGQWKCRFGVWHNKGENCGCWELEKYNKPFKSN